MSFKLLIASFLPYTDSERLYILEPLDQRALTVLNSDDPGCIKVPVRHPSLVSPEKNKGR